MTDAKHLRAFRVELQARATLARLANQNRRIVRRDFDPRGERARLERSRMLDDINTALDEIEQKMSQLRT
jgi:hypothetical protein